MTVRPHLRTALLCALLVACGPSSRPEAPADRPGSAAAALLEARPARLRIEVRTSPGLAPSPTALDLLARRLRERTHKDLAGPLEVEVLLGVLPEHAADGSGHTDAALRSWAQEWASPLPPDTARLSVLYVSGRSARDRGEVPLTLGASVSATAVAVFPEALARNVAPFPRVADLEAAVILHEVGHLMGVVGMGAPITALHQDGFAFGHCRNRGCIMGALHDGWIRVEWFGGTSDEPDFCTDCAADLRAAGGR